MHEAGVLCSNLGWALVTVERERAMLMHAFTLLLQFLTQPSIYGGAGGKAGRRGRGFVGATPQLAACHLTQFYEEWRCVCMLTEWRDRTLSSADRGTCLFIPVGLTAHA